MLPKSVSACLFLLMCLGSTQPAHSQTVTQPGITRVTKLENRFFAHPYNSDTLPVRLSRLEKLIFGSENQAPLEMRLARLSSGVLDTATVDATKPSTVATESAFVAPEPHVSAARPDVGAGKPVIITQDTPAAEPTVVAASPASQSNYPRVTELEREIFERSYESDSILTRVARLEDKVFGRVWTAQANLAVRVDRLGEYAFLSPKVEELERAELQRVSYLREVACQRPQAQPQLTRRTSIPTVVDEIESLETLAYGKIWAGKPISQRVDALEVTLCGSSQGDKQQTITTRVAFLLSKFSNGASSSSHSGV